MTKRIILSAVLVLCALAAHANYVDERSADVKAAAEVDRITDEAGAKAVAESKLVRPTGIRVTSMPVYSVEPTDLTVRSTLSRWAASAGWTHGPEHWTIGKDHPIQGTAGRDVFGPSFVKAVRILVSSTELTDAPVQPCFYSNRVLRIIPAAASCQSE